MANCDCCVVQLLLLLVVLLVMLILLVLLVFMLPVLLVAEFEEFVFLTSRPAGSILSIGEVSADGDLAY